MYVSIWLVLDCMTMFNDELIKAYMVYVSACACACI